MALDTQTGLDVGHLLESDGNEVYGKHISLIEAEARKVLPPGALFSVGSLSDGTGHGHVTLNVQGEYVDHAEEVLHKRFPSLRVVPLSSDYYQHLLDHKDDNSQVALVRQEVERVCQPNDVIFEIRIIACQIEGKMAMVVFVQGEYTDQIRKQLVAVFGASDTHQLDVKPLSGERYHDLNMRRKPGQLIADAAQTV